MRSLTAKSKIYLKTVSAVAVLSGLLAGAVFVGGSGLSMASVLKGSYVQAYNQDNLIRFHVIANSDTPRDQALKRRVRDLIVQEMSPSFSEAKTIADARKIASDHLAAIEEIARQEVRAWGEDYEVRAVMGRYSFPAKNYGKLTLPAGEYEAVRVIIGKGAGANWWCVLFPPMCFVDVSKGLGIAGNDGPVTDSVPVADEVYSEVYNKGTTGVEPETKFEVRFRFLELLKGF
ncbi:MAG: stage II sporulation protein R [Bacillota bacterium]